MDAAEVLVDAAKELEDAAEEIKDDVDKLLDDSQELEDKAIRAYRGSFCTTRNGSKKVICLDSLNSLTFLLCFDFFFLPTFVVLFDWCDRSACNPLSRSPTIAGLCRRESTGGMS